MSKIIPSKLFGKEYFSSEAYADYENDVMAYICPVGRKIFSYIKNRTNPRVLDVGCAHGYLIAQLQNKYSFEVFGLELSAYAINQAVKSVRSKIKKGGILKGANFKPGSFDAVFCQDVCEYLERDKIDKAVGNLVKWSRGYIFFSDIYKHSIKASQKINPDSGRITCLSQREYISIFKKFGARYLAKFNGGSGGDIMIFKK